MTSIAVIGASTELGLAIARHFGARGFDVALIDSDRYQLDDLVIELTREGMAAAAFPADVRDGVGLTQALKSAATSLGGIDVLEYSVSDAHVSPLPSEIYESHVHHQMGMQLYGAIAATKVVLPAMRAAKTGTLLYTTGMGTDRLATPAAADVSAAAAALRNWVLGLHQELTGTGVYAGHVALDVNIGQSTFYGQPRATPDQISPIYWDLHTERDTAERIFTG
ncbi:MULTISPECIES: SDR family NAD(P)-dependent oxidoreductase [unclassified Streptomyces]|uniref:SDR family NAD(P)-dependent oxidoreductase n=1 Tax=unclassified Streptomyces TaxID=2593676 RepID=UPI002E320FDE|nr:SDR family NAD(P)-dependent oxidoreductase [Streptomyces sp. NBC_01689]